MTQAQVQSRLPEWLRCPPGSAAASREVKKLLRASSLNTVCEEARCPNIAECFGRGTATFMLLGDVCTRGCRFCAVTTGKPQMPAVDFAAEGESVAEAVSKLGLKHVVLTSVARDDLEDGGASGFVESIKAIRKETPKTTIEVLVPDFRGRQESVEQVLEVEPEIFNHNLETVPRLYRRVRPGASYERSLEILKLASGSKGKTKAKTGIMFGLGEKFDEVRELMKDAHAAGVQIFTAGQYMRPSSSYLPVESYLEPSEFEDYEKVAKSIGFKFTEISPLSRSSYRAERHLG